MENINLSMNGEIIKCSAFGISDAKLRLRIINGIPPYKVELKINDTSPPTQWNFTPFYRLIENIPMASSSDDFNCIIDNLPAGGYKFRIYDSTLPTPQMNIIFSDWLAASPPFVTLNGSVNPLGIPTTISFEIGETLNYDKVVQAGVSNVAQSTPIALKLSSGDYSPISFLKPNTLYNYRIKATNPSGTVYGENLTFTTPAVLPIVITLPATNIQ